MLALLILEKLEQISGKKAKIELLKANSNNSDLAKLLEAALNYERRYYIKKFTVHSPRATRQNSVNDFMDLLTTLEKREVTGNAAIKYVEDFFETLSELEQKWFARVLRKDLRAGFSADTAVACGFSIPVFDVQLAKSGEECKKLDAILKFGAWASRKVDGYRCAAVITNGFVELLTRSGQPFENFPEIEESLGQIFAGQSIVLDGEIMSDSFNAMQQSAFAATRGTTVGDVAFHIFDIINHDEWVTDKFTTPYGQRLEQLKSLFEKEMPANIRLLEHVAVSSRKEIFALMAQYISEGYEGLMLKPNIPYYRGKVSNKMLKFKEFDTMDCEVLSVYEGTGRLENILGGVTVRQENGVICDVGSGFDDEERLALYKNPEKIIGRIIEVQYQQLTDKDKKMRFPTFQRCRDLGPNEGKI